jgi:hypothetical protein
VHILFKSIAGGIIGLFIVGLVAGLSFVICRGSRPAQVFGLGGSSVFGSGSYTLKVKLISVEVLGQVFLFHIRENICYIIIHYTVYTFSTEAKKHFGIETDEVPYLDGAELGSEDGL